MTLKVSPLILIIHAVFGFALSANAALRCGPVLPSGLQQCEAGIDSNLANIEGQEQNQWCWAACISMVFNYYGHPVSQERIVTETWGAIVNLPGQPWQIIRDLNKTWEDDYGNKFKVSGDVLTANAMTAAQDLAANHPLIIGTGGHAVVLTAETYVRDLIGRGRVVSATVRDPWPGRGRRPLSAQEWFGINFAVRIVLKSVSSSSGVQNRNTFQPAPATQTQSMDFCTAFKQLVAGVHTDFSSLKGQQRSTEPDDIYDEWESKVSLPDAVDCKIKKYRPNRTYQYRCLIVLTADGSKADNVFDDILARAKECLGSGWKFHDDHTDESDESSASKEGVQIEISHLHKGSKHSVHIVFRKPDL